MRTWHATPGIIQKPYEFRSDPRKQFTKKKRPHSTTHRLYVTTPLVLFRARVQRKKEIISLRACGEFNMHGPPRVVFFAISVYALSQYIRVLFERDTEFF